MDLVRDCINEVMPVVVEASFELVYGGGQDDVRGKRVPVVDCWHRQGVPSNPGEGLGLLQLQRVPGRGSFFWRGELIRFDVESSIESLVDDNHIASTSPIVEAGDLQVAESLWVRHVLGARDKFRGSSLHSFYQFLIGSVKWSPGYITIFKMRTNEGLVQERKRLTIDVRE